MSVSPVWPSSPEEYVDQKPVGSGGFAKVVSAECQGRTVAIKKIDLLRSETSASQCAKEVAIWKGLEHEYIVKYFTSFDVESDFWVVSEYMEHGSIGQIMADTYPEGFEEPVARAILKMTLLGLQYLHENEICHRDIKSDNLLIGSDGVVKLADFGISGQLSASSGRVKTFTGTPCWIAPEVADEKGYNCSADIWSFGITAIELVEGHPPHHDLSPAKLIARLVISPPPNYKKESFERVVSKSFKQIVNKCVVKDPKKRPTAEALLKAGLMGRSYFKSAKGADFLRETILKGLDDLSTRYQRYLEKRREEFAALNS